MQLTSYLLTPLVVVIFGLSACQPRQADHTEAPPEESETIMEASEKTSQAKLRHVVLFKFKEDADPEAVEEAIEAFAALPSKIPQIRDFEWGTNNSPEGLNKGLTHCFLLTFNSEQDREIYLPHPDHKAFGALLGDILEDVTVVDYWAN